MHPHSNFVHLHVHTQYSLLDGACRIKDLTEAAHRDHMPALAITDHGNMFGAVEFYFQAKAKGIKPILGCEVYVAPNSRFDRSTSGISDASYHLLLLVKDEVGYRNLMRLVSAGYFEGFYYRPRVDKDLLAKHHQGLIASSACLKGELPSLLARGEYDKAKAVAQEYADIFGRQGFYLEIQKNGIPIQDKVNKELIRLGRELFLPLVATNDCHYLEREDSSAHDILLCIQTGKTKNDPNRLRFSTDEFYFKTSARMREDFREAPEALDNTIRIAEHCNLELEAGRHHLPVPSAPEGYTLDTYLEELARKGLEEHFNDIDPYDRQDPVVARLEHELSVIRHMHFPGYFLIVRDFIKFAKDHGIPVGPGRGSAAGSLVAYSLGITDIDPLQHGLLFERFLNPERISLPDIDIDFCMERRDEVISYVTEKYGRDNVAQIITFGTMAARGVIRDVGRVLEIPYAEVDKIAKLIPPILNITLENALAAEERLRNLAATDKRVAELISVAKKLEGLTRHASTHAAGIVISPQPLVNYTPLYKGPKGEMMTQYSMEYLEKIGLLKMDFLGLRTLTVLKNTVDFIRENRGDEICLEEISLDDKQTYELLCEPGTVGVFQLESAGMRDLLRRLKPECFEDLVASLALFRPGPLGSGMVDNFVKGKHKQISITYEHPLLEPVLRETYGVILYQEQVMKIASVLAGFTPGEADILRRAMGKKKQAEMDRYRQRFVTGAKKNKIKPQLAEKIFDLMAHFAGYGFNKSHSAAYALISYQTAYLKAHYPVEFMAALLTSEMQDTNKINKFKRECLELGIKILPPDVNESSHKFTAVSNNIRFGITAVKNVGEAAVTEIINCRKTSGPFGSLYEFCERVDLRAVNRRVIESLIKCGAFDRLGKRAQLMAALDQAIEQGQNRHKDRVTGQQSLFDLFEQGDSSQGSEIGGLKTSFAPPPLPEVEEWTKQELLAAEKEALGFYITGHPLDHYQGQIKPYITHTSEDLVESREGQRVALAGLITPIKEIRTRNGERMGFANLEDTLGVVEVTLLPDVYKAAEELLNTEAPVLVKGEVYTKDDVPKLRASELRSLESVIKSSLPLGDTPESHPSGASRHKAHIKINTQGLSPRMLTSLEERLSRNKGSSPVVLHLFSPGQYEVTVALNSQFKVSPTSGFARAVEELFGKGSIYFD